MDETFVAEVNDHLRRRRSLAVVVGREPLTTAEAQVWQRAGVDALTTAGWVEVGCRTPQARPVGLDLLDVSVLDTAGVADRSAQWAGVRFMCPKAMAALAATGRPAEQVMAVLHALCVLDEVRVEQMDDDGRIPAGHCCGPYTARGERLWHGFTAQFVTDATRVASLSDDWADLTVCLRAGLTVEEAMTHVREGRDMGPVRVLAGLG